MQNALWNIYLNTRVVEITKCKHTVTTLLRKVSMSSLVKTPAIFQAVSMALNEFPVLNSSPDETCENLIYKVLVQNRRQT